MTPAQAPAPRPPFEVYSVHFNFVGGQAIPLRDPMTDRIVGENPEWVTGQSSRPVAYVRGITPRVQVVFRGTPKEDGSYLVGAVGPLLGVDQASVTLAFDSVSGLTAAIPLSLSGPLPDVIGVHNVSLDWYACDLAAPETQQSLGSSLHEVCTTWRPLIPDSNQWLEDWVYSPLVQWTSRWAAGAGDERQICDAIIRNVASSGLQYGIGAWKIRDMLLRGGGMCGAWYYMFQQMAHSQGVFVHRRFFRVHWRQLQNGEERWCALVIRSGGLNRPRPSHPLATFRDHDGSLADVRTATLAQRTEYRYRFWGMRGQFADGHCINFLQHDGRLVLYDACFGLGPVEIDGPLPPDDGSIWGSQQLASFKARYLDNAVDYMLGSLYNSGSLWRSSRGTSFALEQLGVTVRTAQIPETDNGIDGLTFGWAG
jgi:hypothetical protein